MKRKEAKIIYCIDISTPVIYMCQDTHKFHFDNFIKVSKNKFLFFEQYTSAPYYYEHSIFNPSTAEMKVLRFSKQETIVTFLLYLGVNRLTF